MANNYYTKVGDYTPGTRARGLEVETEFDTIVQGFDSVATVVDTDGTLAQNLKGGATYKLTGMIDGTDTQDYATLANVAAGGSPGDLPITSLGVGTATADQIIKINAGGTAVVGDSGSGIPVTSLGVGTATARQSLEVNAAGTSIVGRAHELGNFLINGDMRVAQQGASYTSATAPANSDDTYLIDGWYLLSDGNDVFDVTQHTTAADLPDGAYAAQRLDVETISKKGGILQILEAREVARLFEGGNGTASLSFKAKRTGSDMEIKAAVLAWDSTEDTVTSDVVSAWGADGTTPTFATNWTAENTPANLSLSTSYQTFRIENISLDTASTTNLAVFIWVDTTTANSGEFVYVTDVQLESGAIATPYQHENIADSILRCRRFLLQYQADSTNEYFIMIQVAQTTRADGEVAFPVTMLSDPTFSVSAAADWKTIENNTNQTCTAVSQIAQTSEDSLISFTTGATMVGGSAGYATAKENDAWMRWAALL